MSVQTPTPELTEHEEKVILISDAITALGLIAVKSGDPETMFHLAMWAGGLVKFLKAEGILSDEDVAQIVQSQENVGDSLVALNETPVI